jgi:hypothetical protein
VTENTVLDGAFFADGLGYIGLLDPYADVNLAPDASPAEVAAAADAAAAGSAARAVLGIPLRRLAWHALRDPRRRRATDVLRARTDGALAVAMASAALGDALAAENAAAADANRLWTIAERQWNAAAGSPIVTQALTSRARALGLEQPEAIASRLQAAVALELLAAIHAVLLAGDGPLAALHDAALERSLSGATGPAAGELRSLLLDYRLRAARAAATADSGKTLDAFGAAMQVAPPAVIRQLEAELVAWSRSQIPSQAPPSSRLARDTVRLLTRARARAGRRFTASRQLSAAYISLGLTLAREQAYTDAATAFASAAAYDPLDADPRRMLGECETALANAGKAIQEVLKKGQSLNAKGMAILAQLKRGFAEANAIVDGPQGRTIEEDLLAGVRAEAAWKLGIADSGQALDDALGAIAAAGTEPSDPERAALAQIAPALSDGAWAELQRLAAKGLATNLPLLALVLPEPQVAVPTPPDARSARGRLLAASAQSVRSRADAWQVGSWLFSAADPFHKLAAVAGIVLLFWSAGSVAFGAYRRHAAGEALVRFEAALRSADDAAAERAGREFVAAVSLDGAPAQFAPRYRDVLLRRLSAGARAGDEAVLRGLSADARALEGWERALRAREVQP